MTMTMAMMKLRVMLLRVTNIHSEPRTINTLYMLFHFIFPTAIRGRYYDDPYLKYEETKAKRG